MCSLRVFRLRMGCSAPGVGSSSCTTKGPLVSLRCNVLCIAMCFPLQCVVHYIVLCIAMPCNAAHLTFMQGSAPELVLSLSSVAIRVAPCSCAQSARPSAFSTQCRYLRARHTACVSYLLPLHTHFVAETCRNLTGAELLRPVCQAERVERRSAGTCARCPDLPPLPILMHPRSCMPMGVAMLPRAVRLVNRNQGTPGKMRVSTSALCCCWTTNRHLQLHQPVMWF